MITTSIKKIYQHFQTDSLFRNSVFLLVATGVMAVFGFFFWLLAARLFSAHDVGLATTLISAMSLIALLSLVGFDIVFVRYLPTSKHKNDYVNTAIILVGGFACILALLFVILVPYIAPKLHFVRDNVWSVGAFLLFCLVAGVNTLTDAYFIAHRQAKFILVINTIFSLFKVGFILLFAKGGPMGIFVGAGLAQLIGMLISIGVMAWKFGYRFQFVVNMTIIRQVRRYSLVTYVSTLLNLLPPAILPLIITNKLGADKSAYFYMALMIVNLLYTVSFASARSLLAEGSHDEQNLARDTKKALRFTMLLTVAGILVILLSGPLVLSIFGQEYASGGTALLNLMAVSGIPVVVYSIYGTIFRVQHKLKIMVAVNFAFAASVIVLAYVLTSLGLTGIGLAWLVGQTVAMVWGVYYEWSLGRRTISA